MTTGIADIEWLDAQVCKLSAENERLKKENDWLAGRLHDAVNTCYGGVTHDQIDARSYEQSVEPHAYVPSAMHMGDCALCGHLQGDPLHSPFRRS